MQKRLKKKKTWCNLRTDKFKLSSFSVCCGMNFERGWRAAITSTSSTSLHVAIRLIRFLFELIKNYKNFVKLLLWEDNQHRGGKSKSAS